MTSTAPVHQAALIGVLDAEDERAVVAAGDQPGIERRAQIADVHIARGAGREAVRTFPLSGCAPISSKKSIVGFLQFQKIHQPYHTLFSPAPSIHSTVFIQKARKLLAFSRWSLYNVPGMIAPGVAQMVGARGLGVPWRYPG